MKNELTCENCPDYWRDDNEPHARCHATDGLWMDEWLLPCDNTENDSDESDYEENEYDC